MALRSVFTRYSNPYNCVKLLCSKNIHHSSCKQLDDRTKSCDPTTEKVWVDKLQFITPESYGKIPIYRIMDVEGQILNANEDPKLDESTVKKMYKDMLTLDVMDRIMYESQRQGRITFYMTSFGEQATHIGSAAALSNDDLVYGQYRESGVLLWRGYTIDNFMNQLFGNKEDDAKGRNMPIHYGSKTLNFVTISSPLCTQVPHAVGAAYAFKLAKSGKCSITYFGDGAASEGDFHAAVNFASTLDCPIIFFCRNNCYAISTHVSEQYRGDGIASRAYGYGMNCIRIDGNDIFAVYNATKQAREYVVKNNRPVLIEAMTYRVGHHSTSDDSTKYRSQEEISKWVKLDNPITRLSLYISKKGWWKDNEEENIKKELKDQVMDAIKKAEGIKKSSWKDLFGDVFADLPSNLKEQIRYMEDHLKKYKDHYPAEMMK